MYGSGPRVIRRSGVAGSAVGAPFVAPTRFDLGKRFGAPKRRARSEPSAMVAQGPLPTLVRVAARYRMPESKRTCTSVNAFASTFTFIGLPNGSPVSLGLTGSST